MLRFLSRKRVVLLPVRRRSSAYTPRSCGSCSCGAFACRCRLPLQRAAAAHLVFPTTAVQVAQDCSASAPSLWSVPPLVCVPRGGHCSDPQCPEIIANRIVLWGEAQVSVNATLVHALDSHKRLRRDRGVAGRGLPAVSTAKKRT